MLSRLSPQIQKFLAPILSLIAKAGVKPNHLSIAGLIAGFISAIFLSSKMLLAGAFFLLISGLFDMFDGLIARSQNMPSAFGGFLDSVIDRYVDIIIFISLGIYGVNWLLISFAMSGALLVSYTRARAECLIEKCDIGLAERPERLIILILGMVSGYIHQSVLIVAIFSHFTALHRIVYTFKESKRELSSQNEPK